MFSKYYESSFSKVLQSSQYWYYCKESEQWELHVWGQVENTEEWEEGKSHKGQC